jgi:aspartate/methionine/tyrosine aminotransferase
MPLFEKPPTVRAFPLPEGVLQRAAQVGGGGGGVFEPLVDDRALDVFRRAANPDDPFELRDLWLGRVEHELGADSRRPWLAEKWRSSQAHRGFTADELLSSRSAVRMVKELFNSFFRDDLYGDLQSDDHLLLSGGSVDEERWGLPDALKECVRYALDRDWYGYSDSCGRIPARDAVAAYESARMDGPGYTAQNVALTMGGTFAMSTLADFVLAGRGASAAPALCAIPNYPPLVEAVARRAPVRLVPAPSVDGEMSIDALIDALTPETPFVMLQTAANPTGAGVSEAALERLIRTASPATVIVLDECHEWLGADRRLTALRAAPNVVRVSSLSKNWSAPGLKVGWILASTELIADYYEYASTSFGGPPSFFYTAVEVLARMERWLITGVERVGVGELAEFEGSYGLDLGRLQAAYESYAQDRRLREDSLRTLRDAAGYEFSRSSNVILPRYSINTLLEFDGWDDSYLCFRSLLKETGVATYPGILTFGFGSGAVRITTARSWDELSEASERLAVHLGDRKEVPVRA